MKIPVEIEIWKNGTDGKEVETGWTPKSEHIYLFLQHLPDTVITSLSKNPEWVRVVGMINTEQLSRPEWKEKLYSRVKLFPELVIFDYSIENTIISGLKNHYFLPYCWVENQHDNRLSKEKDVCMITPYSSSRRSQVFSQLSHHQSIQGFGKKRDEELFRYKILVNVHYSPAYQVHEHMRTDRCIFQHMIVITEPSRFVEHLPLRRFMVVAELEEIPQKVKEVVSNYGYYWSKLFEGMDREAIQRDHQLQLLKHYELLCDRAKNKE